MKYPTRTTRALTLAACAAMASVAHGQVTFNVTYDDVTTDTNFGFDDPTQGAARRATVDRVTAYLSTVIDGRGSANLNFRVSENNPNSNTLASFGPTQAANAGQQYFNNGLAYHRIRLGNTEFGANDKDSRGRFNFGKNFYTGTGTPGAGQIDLFSTVLHEFVHGLGFIDGTPATGIPDPNRSRNYVLSSHLRRGSGPNAAPLYETNLASPNYGKFIGDVSTLTNQNDPNTGLFFHGKYAKEVLGQAVPMYAPPTYNDGSSVSHSNTTNPTGLMHYVTTAGQLDRAFLNYELAMMIDLGYNTYEWDNADGTFAAGATNATLAQSNWRADGAFLNANGTDYNTKANPTDAPILAPYAKATSNIVLRFDGAGATGYTATNDVGTNAGDTFRVARMELNSTATAPNTITGGHFTWGKNADGSNSVLAPAIEQNGSGAFVIASEMDIPNGLTVRGTGTGDVTLANDVTGAGALTKQGNHKLILNGDGQPNSLSFTGGLNITAGTVDLNTAYAGTITNNGGVLNNNVANNNTNIVTKPGTTTNINQNVNQVMQDGGQVNVAPNTNINQVTQDGGVFDLDDGFVLNFDFNDGFLEGDGVIDNLAMFGGEFDPGNSPGGLTINNTTITDGVYGWEIDTLPADGGQAGDADGWDIWNMGNLTLIDDAFEIEITSIDENGDEAPLPGWDPRVDHSFLIATSTNGLFDDELTDFFIDESFFGQFNDLAGGQFGLSTDLSGNELYLDWAAVPEPGSVAALLGLAPLLGRRRRAA